MNKTLKWISALVTLMMCMCLTNAAWMEEAPAAENTGATVTEAPMTENVEAPSAEVPELESSNALPEELPEDAQKIGTLQDALNPDRFIDIYATFEGDTFYLGQPVTLTAVLNGYDNLTYTLQWQLMPEGGEWQNIVGAVGNQIAFKMDEAAYRSSWRVIVNITAAVVE